MYFSILFLKINLCLYQSLIKPFLFKKEAEDAHDTAIELGQYVSQSPLLIDIAKFCYNYNNHSLERTIFGLNFPNPIGLAAGFDKNGLLPNAMQAFRFWVY